MAGSSPWSWWPPRSSPQPSPSTCCSTRVGASPRRGCAAFSAYLVLSRIRRGMTPTSGSGPTGSDLAGIGFYMAAAVLIPLFAGVALDRWWHTAPLFVLVGLFVGLAAAAAGIWMKVRDFSK
ncbi:MAG: AtpZ/AtpI family protein [Chloroflexi bacterium]|nr:MAG: AtpZ/AtpI family protein [Chloroflexota bacterium]